MSNILLTPAKFEDGAGVTPPPFWSPAEGYYELFGNFASSTIVLRTDTPAAAGDVVAFGFYATRTPDDLLLEVLVNATVVFTQTVDATTAYHFTTQPLLAGDNVTIRLTFAGADRELDAYIRPLTEESVEEVGQPDTYVVKGFVSYGSLPDNDLYEVAPLGELSVRSRTYAKDRMLFAGITDAPNPTTIELSLFTSREADGTRVTPPTQYVETLTEIAKWMYNRAIDGIFTADTEIVRQQILAEFNGTIFDVRVGPMVQQGTAYLPQYLTFFIEPDSYGVTWPAPVDYLDRSRIKLWFADAAFQTQYDEFQIENIAPLTDLDDFFRLANLVEQDVNARTVPQLMEQIETAAEDNPYTVVRSINFDYHDPLNPTNRFPTTWTFVIYGLAGDNVDAIKEQLIRWVLDNSTRTREEWAEIFPDIFTSTEFVITPLWNQYAVPNRLLEEGVYSPIVNVAEAGEIVQYTSVGAGYTIPHVRNSLSAVGCPYKSIALLTVGGPENRQNKNRFQEMWPDYMAVSTSSLDFARMSQQTQEFIMLLYALLQTAEVMTESSDMPQGITRVRRENSRGSFVLYAAASYRNVQYLVVAKEWFIREFPALDSEPQNLTIMPNIPSLSTPNGNQTLVATFSATGGRTPYTFVATSPNLVAGGIDPQTGEFNGTFNIWGSAILRIEVTDADMVTVGRNYVVDVPQF